MSTEQFQAGRRAGPATGALLLCRAAPGSVVPGAHLLRERMLLTGAGEEWSVLVPEGGPWRHGGEPVERVVTGWATALAVGAPWPVLGLWWDPDHVGYTLVSGFRRPVGYAWLTNGTPVGEDEAMRTFAARLGLDPVLDMQALEQLAKPDARADARARLRGLLAVLTSVGVSLPTGLAPGTPVDLREAARLFPDARTIEGPEWWKEARAERAAVDHARLGCWVAGPRARTLALVQMAAGLPLTAWGLRHRSGGWTAAGVLLLTHGALGPAYELTHLRD
jgi:hypothetical protein